MKEVRDIAGITLPFAAGVAVSISALSCPGCQDYICAGMSMAIFSVSSISLIHPSRKSRSSRKICSQIAILLFSAGLVCGFTSGITAVSRSSSWIMTHAAAAGDRLKMLIDSLPFADPDTNAIIKALITGERSDIPAHISDAFRKSGASHILALSGLHLGMIYGIISKGLGFLGNSPYARRARSLTTISLCVFYTLATGAGPSIKRALLFIILGESARITGRYRSTASILFAALLIQLAVTPYDLKSAGFQLSYAAMAGIAFIYPWLKGLWPERDNRGWDPIKAIWESAAMSISCQITTAPVAYIYFKSFPMHFLLTNLIALPLTGVIIPAGLLTICLSGAGICPEIMLRATEMLVKALSEALGIIACM